MVATQAAFSRGNLVMLSLTFFLYFGQLGVLVPYLGVFLDGRGFSSQEIGELFALITLMRIIGPNLFAAFADKSGKSLRILQFGAFLTFATFCSIFWLNSFWGLTVAFGLMMLFFTAIAPQTEVITLGSVRGDATKYSHVRLWGSIGFIVLTVLAGKLIDVFSSEAPIYISGAVLLGLFLVTLGLKEASASERTLTGGESIWKKVRTKVFIGFIVSSTLIQVSFGPYYGFFALYARDLAYTGQETGALIALGVAAEVIIFLLAGKLISRFGVKRTLLVSMLLTALRWHLLAVAAQHWPALVVSQMLHAFSFGLIHAASINFIHHYFGHQFRSQGQALYTSIGFGVGGAAGNFGAGLIWDQGQGAEIAFTIATVFALLGAGMVAFIPSRYMPK
ncbi:MFS transporter [Paraglaciecola mesophila]|nr:MFS transporter [Paraglaciecola mesophila]